MGNFGRRHHQRLTPVAKPGVSIKVDDSELVHQLKRLEDKVAGAKTLRGALVAGARPMRDEAKARAPEDSGELKRKIGVRSKKVARWGFEAFIAAKVYYAHLVEFGAAPHFVSKKSRAGTSVLHRKIHPGSPAQPFLRPAFDMRKDDSVRTVAKRLRDAIRTVTRGR